MRPRLALTLWNEEFGTYITVTMTVVVSTILSMFFVVQHEFGAIEVAQFQATVSGRHELR